MSLWNRLSAVRVLPLLVRVEPVLLSLLLVLEERRTNHIEIDGVDGLEIQEIYILVKNLLKKIPKTTWMKIYLMPSRVVILKIIINEILKNKQENQETSNKKILLKTTEERVRKKLINQITLKT